MYKQITRAPRATKGRDPLSRDLKWLKYNSDQHVKKKVTSSFFRSVSHNQQQARKKKKSPYTHPQDQLINQSVTMKQSSIQLLQISALVGVSYAQTQGQGMGIGPTDLPNALLLNANQHPNATKSVPFAIGSINFTLTVNVTELTIPANITTSVQNPRIINSVTGLSWTGDKSLNETITDEELSHTSPGGPPAELCVQFPLGGLFSRSETNGYRDSDNGDCTHALGKKCVDAIKKKGGATSTGPMCYGGSGPVPREECNLAPWGSFSSGRKYFFLFHQTTKRTDR